jgi:hypothetical protein
MGSLWCAGDVSVLILDVISCCEIYIIFLERVLFTYLLTYSMEETPSWEAKLFAASQEIPRILWNPKVHFLIYKCSPPVSILSQPNPVHNPISHFLEIHININLPSAPGSPQWSLSHRFPHQNPLHASPLTQPSYMPRPSHYSRFYHLHNSGWGVQIMKLLIMKFLHEYERFKMPAALPV